MAYAYAGRLNPEAVINAVGNVQLGTAVLVNLAGTGTAATLYTDRTKASTTPNPFLTTAQGNYPAVFLDPGDYDVVLIVDAVVQPAFRVTVRPDPSDWEPARVQMDDPSVWIDTRARGAQHDGSTDDASFINDALADGVQVYVAAGTGDTRVGASLTPQSNQTVRLAPNAKIRALGTLTGAGFDAAVFLIDTKDNVTIEGGTLDGDRTVNVNKGTYGVVIVGSTRVRLINVMAVNFPGTDAAGTNGGDGFYIHKSGAVYSVDVTLKGCTADNCVRQGLSIISGKNFRILNCNFTNIVGSNPGCGIDIEPNNGTDVISDVLIDGFYIENCDRGISVSNTTAMANITIGRGTIRTTRNTVAGHGIFLSSGTMTGFCITGPVSIEETVCCGVYMAGDGFAISRVTVKNATTARQANNYGMRVTGAKNWSIRDSTIYVTAAASTDGLRIESATGIGRVEVTVDCGGQNTAAIRSDNSVDISFAGSNLRNTGGVGDGISINNSGSGGTGHSVTGVRATGFNNGVALNAATSANLVDDNVLAGCTTKVNNLAGGANTIGTNL